MFAVLSLFTHSHRIYILSLSDRWNVRADQRQGTGAGDSFKFQISAVTLNIELVYLCLVAESLIVVKINVNMAESRHTFSSESELDSSDLLHMTQVCPCLNILCLTP